MFATVNVSFNAYACHEVHFVAKFMQSRTHVPNRPPKTDENDLLIFIFVDPFSKSLVDYLFLLIFQQISTNKQIQQKQINK